MQIQFLGQVSKQLGLGPRTEYGCFRVVQEKVASFIGAVAHGSSESERFRVASKQRFWKNDQRSLASNCDSAEALYAIQGCGGIEENGPDLRNSYFHLQLQWRGTKTNFSLTSALTNVIAGRRATSPHLSTPLSPVREMR